MTLIRLRFLLEAAHQNVSVLQGIVMALFYHDVLYRLLTPHAVLTKNALHYAKTNLHDRSFRIRIIFALALRRPAQELPTTS